MIFKRQMLSKCYSEFNYKARKDRIDFISSILIDIEFVKVESNLSIIEGVVQFLVTEVSDVFPFDVFDHCI